MAARRARAVPEALERLEQAGVLDRDRRLVGEGLEELGVGVVVGVGAGRWRH